jgi:hypothetical protein
MFQPHGVIIRLISITYLFHNMMCISYYGREISLLTNYVTIQFLCVQIRIKMFVAIALKLKIKNENLKSFKL